MKTKIFNMLYQPKLSNGKVVPLTWPIVLYRLFNNIFWPLEKNASTLARTFDCFCWVLAFLIFVQHWEAEIRFLRENINNMDQMLTGVPTHIILIETWLRGIPLGLIQEKSRIFMENFYTKIYITESSQPRIFKKIRQASRPAFVVASLYLSTLVLHLILPIVYLVNQRRDTLYKMTYPFDITPFYIYLPIILSNAWVGFIVTSYIYGENNVMSEIILHLNGRFILLQQDFNQRVRQFLEHHNDDAHIAKEFRREIIITIKQNLELNEFAAEIQKEFSFRIFVMFALSAVLLCALGFKVYTNPVDSIAYIFWMCGKILEMLVIGQLGSIIIDTTDKMSSMYYNSHWEDVILRSSDKPENVKLMKLITLAIELNMKPFCLTGLDFFSVSLTSVLKILQGAGSYFTCLISLR